MAVRRALYLTRLRRLDVSPRSVALWVWLHDGWGWEAALPIVQAQVRRSALATRRELNSPMRVRSPLDLRDNVDVGVSSVTGGLDYRQEFLPARYYLAETLWGGRAGEDATMIPALLAMMRATPELAPRGEADLREVADIGALVEGRRNELGLRAIDVPEWLGQLDPAAVERGRRLWWMQFSAFRQLGQRTGRREPPRLLGYPDRGALAAALREKSGRPTTTLVLAEAIAGAMFAAHLLDGIEIEGL